MTSRATRIVLVVVTCLAFLGATAAVAAAQDDGESTTTSEPPPAETQPESPEARDGSDESEDLEPAEVPIWVWIGLGALLVAAIAWGLTSSRSGSDSPG